MSEPIGIRNDNGSTVIQAANLGKTRIATDEFGRTILAPNEDPVNVSIGERSGTATTTHIASANTATTLFSANDAARGRMIINYSNQALSIKFGTGASVADSGYVIQAGLSWVIPSPIYTGIITGCWAAVNGEAVVTEW